MNILTIWNAGKMLVGGFRYRYRYIKWQQYPALGKLKGSLYKDLEYKKASEEAKTTQSEMRWKVWKINSYLRPARMGGVGWNRMFVDDKETLLVFRFAHWTRNLERFSRLGVARKIFTNIIAEKLSFWNCFFFCLLQHIAWNLSIAASLHPRYLCGLF